MKFLLELAEHVDFLATLVGGVVFLSGAAFTLWRWSITVKEMFEKTQDTACKVDVLEKQILRSLRQIQLQSLQNAEKNDQRLDRIEGRLSYLFGKTNTTIPPRD